MLNPINPIPTITVESHRGDIADIITKILD